MKERKLFHLLNLQLFAEDEKPADQEPQTAEEYAAAIKSLKDSTVKKEDYEKLLQEKKVLIKALAEGEDLPSSDKEGQQGPDIKALREDLRKAGETNMSNAEYVEKSLQLRKALIDAGEPDPFLPIGAKVSPTLDDIKGAEKAANAFQQWLDDSRGEDGKIDPELFNAYLKKGIAEDNPLITARLRAGKSKK